MIAFAIWLLSLDLVYAEEKRVSPDSSDEVAQVVWLIGSLKAPCRLAWTPEITLMSALSAAGGFSLREPKTIYIYRRGVRLEFDPSEVRKGMTTDPQLQPGDVIHVPHPRFPR